MPIDPDRVRERFLSLQTPGALDRLLDDRRAAVVQASWQPPGSAEHHPEPLHEVQLGRLSRRMTAKPGATGVRVGRDALGRPVIAEDITPDGAFLMHLLSYWDDEIEVVAGAGGAATRHVEVISVQDGRPSERVLAGRGPIADAAPIVNATRWRYTPLGTLQSVTTVHERPQEWLPEVVGAFYAPDGALASVARYVLDPFAAPDHEAALDRVADLWPAQVAETTPTLLWSAGPVAAPPGPDPAPDLRVADRDALATIVGAERAGRARWALVLEAGGAGVSRLGGRPVLPEGVPWPMRGDVPMTHLATIAFDELPEVEGRDALPVSGTLAFFADTSDDAVHELVDAEPGSDTYTLVFTAADAPAHEPAAPDGPPRGPYDCPVTLSERRVTFVPRLQVPEDLDDREDPAPAVNGPTPHQLLGFPLGAQGDPRDSIDAGAELEVLLNVGWDEGLGFEYLDAGELTFLAAPAELCDGRWDRVRVAAGSH